MQAAANSCSTAGKSLLRSFLNLSVTPKNFASGRWYPQPERHAAFSTTAEPPGSTLVASSKGSLVLDKEKAAPIYYKPKGDGKGFALVPGKKDEMLANYPLFEESIKRAAVPWNCYNTLTSEERDIYMKHLQAIEERRLSYNDPKTGYTVFTVCHHLQKAKCCGNGCRHCPYEMVNAPENIRREKVWNGAFYV